MDLTRHPRRQICFCFVDGCDWTLGTVTGEDPSAIEAQIQEHMEKRHTVLEFCRTIATLRARLAGSVKGEERMTKRKEPFPAYVRARSLFEEPAAEDLRDAGADQVLRNEADRWREKAWNALEDLAATGRSFTFDDVRDRAGSPAHPNSAGALFLAALKRGMIERCGESKAARRQAHARRVALYRGAR